MWTLKCTCALLLIIFPRLSESEGLNLTFYYGSAATTIQDHVCEAGDVIRTIQTSSDLHCSYICLTNQTCLSFFYHHGNMFCVMCNQLYTDTSDLATYPGMIYYRQAKGPGLWNEWASWSKCSISCGGGSRSRTRTCDLSSFGELTTDCVGASLETDDSCNDFACFPLANTCADWATRGMSESNNDVDIDVDGNGSQFGVVTVACDFNSEPGKAITVLHHNKEARTLVDGYESCGSYSAVLTYTAGFEEAKAIADLSTGCSQYVKWECLSADLSWPRFATSCTSWKNRNMAKSSYFTGPHPSGKYCRCGGDGETSTCYNMESECSCDSNANIWLTDDGNVTNKDDLPIYEFNAGDTGYSGTFDEKGYHTVGPLLCF